MFLVVVRDPDIGIGRINGIDLDLLNSLRGCITEIHDRPVFLRIIRLALFLRSYRHDPL